MSTVLGTVGTIAGITSVVKDLSGSSRRDSRKWAKKEAEKQRVAALNTQFNQAFQGRLTDQANYNPSYYRRNVAGREDDVFRSHAETAPIAVKDRPQLHYTGEVSNRNYLDRARSNFA